MGYSKSKATLDKFRPFLEQVEKGGFPAWDVKEGQADKLAYRIREALYIARLYPEAYPELARVSAGIRVVVTSPSHVEIKAAVGTPEAVLLADPGESALAVQGIANAEKPVATQQQNMTAEQVIEAWKGQQPSNSKLTFPYANLEPAELLKLHEWSSKLTPPWLMLEFDGKLTLQPWSRDIADLAWSPGDIR